MATRIAWLLAGALIVFGFLAGFSIGLPFLGLGALVLAALVVRGERRGTGTDEGPLFAGAGLVLIAVGVLNLGTTLGTVLLGMGIGVLAVGRARCHGRVA